MMGRDWYYCKFIVKLKFCAQTLHQIYFCCYLVTRDVFYVTFHSESFRWKLCSKTCFDAVGQSRTDREIRSELRLVF